MLSVGKKKLRAIATPTSNGKREKLRPASEPERSRPEMESESSRPATEMRNPRLPRKWGSANTDGEKVRVGCSGFKFFPDTVRFGEETLDVESTAICRDKLPGDDNMEGGVAIAPSQHPAFHYNQLYKVANVKHRIGCTIEGYLDRHRRAEKTSNLRDIHVGALRIQNIEQLDFLDE